MKTKAKRTKTMRRFALTAALLLILALGVKPELRRISIKRVVVLLLLALRRILLLNLITFQLLAEFLIVLIRLESELPRIANLLIQCFATFCFFVVPGKQLVSLLQSLLLLCHLLRRVDVIHVGGISIDIRTLCRTLHSVGLLLLLTTCLCRKLLGLQHRFLTCLCFFESSAFFCLSTGLSRSSVPINGFVVTASSTQTA